MFQPSNIKLPTLKPEAVRAASAETSACLGLNPKPPKSPLPIGSKVAPVCGVYLGSIR